MIQHSMKVVNSIVSFVNPGQVPIIAMDQPLFALAKQVQWDNASYGEDKFIIMFGGFYIKMAVLKMLDMARQ